MIYQNLDGFWRRVLFFRCEIFTVVAVPVGWILFLLLSGKGSSVFAIGSWWTMSAGTDSWMPLNKALEQMAAGESIYGPLFFEEHIKFQYPPSCILIFSWLKDLGIGHLAMLNRLNWWFVAGNALLVAVLGVTMAKDSGNETIRRNWLFLGCLSLLACLLSYPVLRGYALGQVQVWINFLFALACVCWNFGKKSIAGAAIGLICLIKPQFCLFLLWGLIAGQRGFLLGWMAIFIPVTIASLAIFGIGEHVEYLRVLSALSQTGESYYANQSVNGMLNRLLENGPVLKWEGNSFPPVNSFVRWSTLLSSVLIVGAVFVRQLNRRASLGDFQLAALAFTLASPIAWEHHYGIMPAIFVCSYFSFRSLEDRRMIQHTGVFLALSFLLSQVSLINWGGISAAPWNLLYSHHLFGVGILFFIMFYSKVYLTKPKAAADTIDLQFQAD
jgi:hypothetical protein